jgi:hypothetical protein
MGDFSVPTARWLPMSNGRVMVQTSGGLMKNMAALFGVVLLPIGAPAPAQTGARAEILILGTYHMANPGRDVFNTRADDMLAPQRQQQIAQLVEVLKRFRPTKIAIEADATGQRAGREYADYVAGKYQLTRNEIDQIGYRLAKELGHRAIYPVDVDGDFPLLRVINYAKANGRAAQFESVQAATGRMVQEQNDFLRSHTVLEMLEYMNSDTNAARAMAGYFALVPFGEPWEYAGPDLLAAWYQRNIRIYRNIRALVESPSERVLVIYGAGHLSWLRQDVENDATVQLRKLSDLTRVAAEGHR